MMMNRVNETEFIHDRQQKNKSFDIVNVNKDYLSDRSHRINIPHTLPVTRYINTRFTSNTSKEAALVNGICLNRTNLLQLKGKIPNYFREIFISNAKFGVTQNSHICYIYICI